jgi:MFS family permease
MICLPTSHPPREKGGWHLSGKGASPLSTPPEAAVDELQPAFSHPVLNRALAAFAYRDFRILWFGAFASTIGTWMQKVAQSWLVFDLTKSTFYLGLDDFLGQLPILLFTIIGGVIADRHERRRLLIGSQCVQMATAFILAALVFSGVVQVWYVLLLSFTTGLAQAFGGPAYQALIPLLVRKKDLPNAIAFNSIQFNLARAIGPLLAGATLAAVGMAACFGLNGLSYLLVIGALLSLSVKQLKPAERNPIVHELRGGLSYMRRQHAMIALAVAAFLTTFLSGPLITFLPAFASEVFEGDIGQYSWMMAFSGTGSVAGALVVAWLGRFKHMGVTLLAVEVLFGTLMVAFANSQVLWLSHMLLFLCGMSLMIVTSMMFSLVQLLVPDQLRGRVVSIYMVAFRGGMPLGSLAAGYAATLTSAPTMLTINGVLVVAVALYFLARSHGVREL